MLLFREAEDQCFLTHDETETIIQAVCTEYTFLMFFYFSLFIFYFSVLCVQININNNMHEIMMTKIITESK